MFYSRRSHYRKNEIPADVKPISADYGKSDGSVSAGGRGGRGRAGGRRLIRRYVLLGRRIYRLYTTSLSGTDSPSRLTELLLGSRRSCGGKQSNGRDAGVTGLEPPRRHKLNGNIYMVFSRPLPLEYRIIFIALCLSVCPSVCHAQGRAGTRALFVGRS